MTDPLEAHLWFLLIHQNKETVTLEDVCWFDSWRAQRTCEAAGMIERYGKYVPGVMTAKWATQVFSELRSYEQTNRERRAS